jgi:hypothetical protein
LSKFVASLASNSTTAFMLLLKTILDGVEGINRNKKIKIQFITGFTPLWTVVPQNDASLAMTQKTEEQFPLVVVILTTFAMLAKMSVNFRMSF